MMLSLRLSTKVRRMHLSFASNWIYKTTAPDSKLRLAFIDKCAFGVGGDNFAKFAKLGILLPDLVGDVFLARKSGSKTPIS